MKLQRLQDFIHEAIHKELQRRTAEVVDQAAKEAAAEVHKRVAAEVDAIAIAVLKHYQMETHTDHIVITVKKELKNA